MGETPAKAREERLALLGQNAKKRHFLNREATRNLQGSKIDPDMPDAVVDVEHMMDRIWIVGDPQECTDQIRHLYEGLGGFGGPLAISQDPDGPAQASRCLQLLKGEVGPRIARLT